MDIYVLDGLNGRKDIIDSYESVIWNIQFFDFGEFVLTVPRTKKNIRLLKKDVYLVRDFDMTSSAFYNVMIIEKVETEYEIEKGWIITVSGKGLKSLLRRRVIWNQANYNGNVEQGIRQAVTDNAINPTASGRKITGLALGPVKNIAGTFEAQLCGENLGEWLVETGTAYGIGWDIYIYNGSYIFELKTGTDRSTAQSDRDPVIFSPEYDNLVSVKVSEDWENFINAGLVVGEGEGVNTRTASVGSATGLARYEDYINGGSVSSNGEIITLATYLKMLQSFGEEEIKNRAYTRKVEAEVIADGLFKLNEDYYLGDIVQMEIEGISAKTRILEIIYSEDANGVKIVPTFGEWEE